MTLTRSGSEIAEYFEEAMQALVLGTEGSSDVLLDPLGRAMRPRFNLAPSHEILTLVPGPIGTDAAAQFAWKRWGLIPAWAKDEKIASRLFNARSETVDVKPSFRAAFKRRRCLVAADGFYEWTPRKRDHQPFHFRAADGHLMAFAGLFESWRGEGGEVVESCTVLTTEANEDLEGVHHRMPVILETGDYACWLDPEADLGSVKALMLPAPAGRLLRKAVGRHVNDPRRDDASCLELEPAPDVSGSGADAASGQGEGRAAQADPPATDQSEEQPDLFGPEPGRGERG